MHTESWYRMLRSVIKRGLPACLWHLLGRRRFVRLAQFLCNEARLDNGAQECGAGERLVLEALGRILKVRGGKRAVILDIGANVGDWARAVLDAASEVKAAISIHAFEPCPSTRRKLLANLKSWADSSQIFAHAEALSSSIGYAEFFSRGDGHGSNGLYRHDGIYPRDAAETITVPTTTLDAWTDPHEIAHITFAKIDAEGHDYEILAGAQRLLSAGRIDMIQFEYNNLWIAARRFLLDAFDLLLPRGYAIGKITRLGVEWYGAWHWELDRFGRGANYLAVKPQLRSEFASVPWWR